MKRTFAVLFAMIVGLSFSLPIAAQNSDGPDFVELSKRLEKSLEGKTPDYISTLLRNLTTRYVNLELVYLLEFRGVFDVRIIVEEYSRHRNTASLERSRITSFIHQSDLGKACLGILEYKGRYVLVDLLLVKQAVDAGKKDPIGDAVIEGDTFGKAFRRAAYEIELQNSIKDAKELLKKSCSTPDSLVPC